MYKIFDLITKSTIYLLYQLISLCDFIDYKFVKHEKLLDNYKTIEDIELNDLLIQTDTGYKPITHVLITKPFTQYKIKLENGYELTCADEHIVFDERFCELYVEDLFVGQHIQTDMGLQKIVSIDIDKTKISMCDTSVDDENHRFYSNGILSHNSTTTAIYILWRVLFNTDKTGLILSKSGPAGQDLIKKTKDMFLYLPYHLKCGVMKWNMSEISFDNNSSISTEAFSSTAGLGKTINLLVLDEFAWCPPNDVDMFYNNIIPTVTTISNSNVCIMSTQNGYNLFYTLWKGAIEERNIYAPFKVDWDQVPQYNTETKQWEKRTQEWKDMMVGVLGSEEAFQYQYGTQFSASDKCLVSRECLSRIRDNTILFKSPKIEDWNNAGISIMLQHLNSLYVKPEYNLRNFVDGKHFYIVLVDLAEGGGGDYTIFNIIEVTFIEDKIHFEQIAYWRANKVDIDTAALEFWLLVGQFFNNPNSLISIEWNTYGALFYKSLKSLNDTEQEKQSLWRYNVVGPYGIDLYNIVRYKKETIEQEAADDKKRKSESYVPGIKFSVSNKKTACTLLKILFEHNDITITDIVTCGELESFEDKNGNGSYKASYGHDDLIMTFCQIPMLQNTIRFKNWIEEISVGINSGSSNEDLNLYNFAPMNEQEALLAKFDSLAHNPNIYNNENASNTIFDAL